MIAGAGVVTKVFVGVELDWPFEVLLTAVQSRSSFPNSSLQRYEV